MDRVGPPPSGGGAKTVKFRNKRNKGKGGRGKGGGAAAAAGAAGGEGGTGKPQGVKRAPKGMAVRRDPRKFGFKVRCVGVELHSWHASHPALGAPGTCPFSERDWFLLDRGCGSVSWCHELSSENVTATQYLTGCPALVGCAASV